MNEDPQLQPKNAIGKPSKAETRTLTYGATAWVKKRRAQAVDEDILKPVPLRAAAPSTPPQAPLQRRPEDSPKRISSYGRTQWLQRKEEREKEKHRREDESTPGRCSSASRRSSFGNSKWSESYHKNLEAEKANKVTSLGRSTTDDVLKPRNHWCQTLRAGYENTSFESPDKWCPSTAPPTRVSRHTGAFNPPPALPFKRRPSQSPSRLTENREIDRRRNAESQERRQSVNHQNRQIESNFISATKPSPKLFGTPTDSPMVSLTRRRKGPPVCHSDLREIDKKRAQMIEERKAELRAKKEAEDAEAALVAQPPKPEPKAASTPLSPISGSSDATVRTAIRRNPSKGSGKSDRTNPEPESEITTKVDTSEAEGLRKEIEMLRKENARLNGVITDKEEQKVVEPKEVATRNDTYDEQETLESEVSPANGAPNPHSPGTSYRVAKQEEEEVCEEEEEGPIEAMGYEDGRVKELEEADLPDIEIEQEEEEGVGVSPRSASSSNSVPPDSPMGTVRRSSVTSPPPLPDVIDEEEADEPEMAEPQSPPMATGFRRSSIKSLSSPDTPLVRRRASIQLPKEPLTPLDATEPSTGNRSSSSPSSPSSSSTRSDSSHSRCSSGVLFSTSRRMKLEEQS